MKRVSMIIATLMVVLSISTMVLAESNSAMDSRFFSAGSVVMASTGQVAAYIDRRDARDTDFMRGLGTFGESDHYTPVALDRRDIRDLGLFGGSRDAALAEPDNSVLICCQK